jgi:hypothetical protein
MTHTEIISLVTQGVTALVAIGSLAIELMDRRAPKPKRAKRGKR